MRLDLWKTSGHTNYLQRQHVRPVEVEKADYQLKPMNCPGHILIYKSKLHSYRDLPVRLAELAPSIATNAVACSRLASRPRFTQDDAILLHALANRIRSGSVHGFCLRLMKNFGFDKFEVELSDWDPKHPENYPGKPEDWQHASDALARTMARMNIPIRESKGKARSTARKSTSSSSTPSDARGSSPLCSRLQSPSALRPAIRRRRRRQTPAFDGSTARCSVSVERFFGILIEHYAGAFPLWLAPVQVEICPVSEKVADYAKHVTETLKRQQSSRPSRRPQRKAARKNPRRAAPENSLHARRWPQGSQAGTVAVRHRSKGDLGPQPLAELVEALQREVHSRATT